MLMQGHHPELGEHPLHISGNREVAVSVEVLQKRNYRRETVLNGTKMRQQGTNYVEHRKFRRCSDYQAVGLREQPLYLEKAVGHRIDEINDVAHCHSETRQPAGHKPGSVGLRGAGEFLTLIDRKEEAALAQ